MLLTGLWKSKVSNTAHAFRGLTRSLSIYIYTHTHKYFSLQNEMRTTSAFIKSCKTRKSIVIDTEWHMSK